MATGLNATITSNLPQGISLQFEALAPVHGQPPTANPTTISAGGASTVLAPPVDPVLGPSSEGSFVFSLSNGGGAFLFKYDFHDSPNVFSCQAPPGYSATTSMGTSGNCWATLTANSAPKR